jgi:polysaccharide pyruvyl transferase WcaK-like protein
MKISFFGNFGQGNVGNESTLQAILYNLRQHSPDAEVNCICTGPEATATTHNIGAVPIHDIFVPGLLRKNPLARFLRKVFIGIPSELYRWLKAFNTLEGTDMFIVPGTQFLSDNLTGPFGWPYMAFKWSVTAKLRRCKLLFVSVGVGPLRHPLSRFFVKSALLLADYRSYRDDSSRQYMRRIGFDPTNDPVYPDLAFSLPTPTIARGSQSNRGKPVIAVGVADHHGQHGPGPRQHQADDIYRHYLDKVTAFVAWLLERKYTVRLVIGDVSYDTQVLADLRKSLHERKVNYENHQVIDEPIESVQQLISQLATSDIVVSPRFHNVVLALLLNRPVIALSYHEKLVSLMDAVGLSKYCQHIDHLDVDKLIDQLIEIEKNAEDLRPYIKQKTEEYRQDLDRQYAVIFKDV